MLGTVLVRIRCVLKECLNKLHVIIVRRCMEWAPVLAACGIYISGLLPVRDGINLLIGAFMSVFKSKNLRTMSILDLEQVAFSADPFFPPVVSTSAPYFSRSSIELRLLSYTLMHD